MLAALSRVLLDPAASLLGDKRLLIVAGDALLYVPFSALPAPGKATPMVLGHEIVALPSASTLMALRTERAGRPRPAGTIAVLADPVFDRSDDRLKAPREAAVAASTDKAAWQWAAEDTRAVGENGRLPRLRYSRDEAQAILALTPRASRFAALDFAANRTTMLSDRLRNYRIIHLATHGFVDSTHPELSGVALSLVDERGQSIDGFLRLHEIYRLKLPARPRRAQRVPDGVRSRGERRRPDEPDAWLHVRRSLNRGREPLESG